MLEKYSKIFKHNLKNKVKVTTATMVAILLGSFATEARAFNPLTEIVVNETGVLVTQTFGALDSIVALVTAGGDIEVTVEEINAVLGAIITGENVDVSIGELNAALGVYFEGTDLNINIDRLNAAVGILGQGDSNTINVGKLNALLGVGILGNNNTITIENYINAVAGVLVDGDGNKVINDGTIAAILGVATKGNKNEVINNEAIHGIVGITSEGDENKITNNGEMINLVGMNSLGDKNILTNKGTMFNLVGMNSEGNSNQLVNNGDLIGLLAINSKGDLNIIKNDGTILSLGLADIAEVAINSVGDSNKIYNNNILLSLGLLNQTTVGVNSIGDSNTIENASILGAISVGIDAGEINFGNTTGINSEGTGVNITNKRGTLSSDPLKVLGGVILATGFDDGDSRGISSIGNNGFVKNGGTIAVVDLNSIDLGEIDLESLLGGLANGGALDAEAIISLVTQLIGSTDAGTGTGIYSKGNKKILENTGTIIAGTGIYSNGDENTIRNSSLIGILASETGIVVQGDNNTIENKPSSSVLGQALLGSNVKGEIGIEILSDGTDRSTGNKIINNAKIDGEETAIYVDGDKTTIINQKLSGIVDAEISGDIVLNGSENIVDNKSNSTINGDTISIGNKFVMTNAGTINGTISSLGNDASVTNTGIINVSGATSVGIKIDGENSKGLNKGTIVLKQEGSQAMLATGAGSNVTNNGTIKLDYTTDRNITVEELQEIRNSVIDSEGDATHQNNGLIKNKDGKIIYAGGGHISEVYTEGTGVTNFKFNFDKTRYEIKNLDKDEAVNTDYTVAITGNTLNGVLNANEFFEDSRLQDADHNSLEDEDVQRKYLVAVENSNGALNINGIVNGSEYGVNIGTGSTVNLAGAVNAEKVAINMENNSKLNMNGGLVTGDIEGTGKVSIKLNNESLVEGDIKTGTGDDLLEILGGSLVTGEINLGAGNDKFVMDGASSNLLGEGSIINGGTGDNTADFGTIGKFSSVNGTIKNFETITFHGDVYLNHTANITKDEIFAKTNFGAGNVVVDGKLIMGLEEEMVGEETVYHHAFENISENTIGGNGTLFADTTDLNIGKDGIIVDLKGTEIDETNLALKATQFIYSVEYLENMMKNELYISLITDLTKMGLGGEYNDVWNSILAADQETKIENLTTYGNVEDLQALLFKTKFRNVYSLGNKLAYDSIKLYQLGTEKFAVMPKTGEWLIQAEGIGRHGNEKEKNAHFMTGGALVGGEYGINATTSMGVSFGAGKQTAKYKETDSEIKGDTLYFGAYGKTSYNKFKFLVGAGYQHNKYKAENVNTATTINEELGIVVRDILKNSSKFDNNGFNIFAEAKYIHELRENLKLEPKLALAFNHLNQKYINEGTNDWAISVDSYKQNVTDFDLGLDLVKVIQGNNEKGELKLTLNQRFSTGDVKKNLVARFNGNETSNFSVEGYSLGKARTTVGVGASIEKDNGVFYGMSYGYEFGSGTKTDKVTVGAGYKF